jgi:mono/diheme cytochrome c family protein
MPTRKSAVSVPLKEDYSGLMLGVTLLALLIVIGFGYYWMTDQRRLVKISQDYSRGLVAHGESLYTSQCASCHGLTGEGGVGLALNDQALLKNTPDGVFYSIIRSGIPQTKMPAWAIDYGGPLTDEEIRAVTAYIRAWEK